MLQRDGHLVAVTLSLFPPPPHLSLLLAGRAVPFFVQNVL